MKKLTHEPVKLRPGPTLQSRIYNTYHFVYKAMNSSIKLTILNAIYYELIPSRTPEGTAVAGWGSEGQRLTFRAASAVRDG